jgi:hypothetical protein
MRIFSSVENLRRVLRRISLTLFSVFDMLILELLYLSLKVADVSLSEPGHLAPCWLTSHNAGIPSVFNGHVNAKLGTVEYQDDYVQHMGTSGQEGFNRFRDRGDSVGQRPPKCKLVSMTIRLL